MGRKMTAGQDNALLFASSILVALGYLFRYLRLPLGSAERRAARKGVIAGLFVVPFCWIILYGRLDAIGAAATSTAQQYTLPITFAWFTVALLTFGSVWFLTYFALAILRGLIIVRSHMHL
jgi:hypothetical protein